MIEVKLVLQDTNELMGFGQFMAQLEQHRKTLAVAQEPIIDAQYDGPPPPPPAEPAPAPVETPVTPIDLISLMKAFVDKQGLPAAQALVAEFGARRATEVSADKMDAFVARLRASIA